MRSIQARIFRFIILSGGVCCGVFVLFALGIYVYISQKLPEASRLKNVNLQTPLRIFSKDKLLMAEYGEKKRYPVTYNEIPKDLISGFLSAEDSGFYSNSGVDVKSLFRAVWELMSTGHILTGGSTITMQLARNFFLSSERVFSRKLREILLALRITKALTKKEIITLYLNKIYLGNRAYGVQAASFIYYGKPLRQLSLAQKAMLAGLPKAPSAYNPLINPKRAMQRRNWVLFRMQKTGFINQKEYEQAIQEPVTATNHFSAVQLKAPYVAEMVRQKVVKLYGDSAYTSGFNVYSTVDSKDQKKAAEAVLSGAERYDQKHGYRGPEKNAGNDESLWENILNNEKTVAKYEPAIVTAANVEGLNVLLKKGASAVLSLRDINRYSFFVYEKRKLRKVEQASDFFKVGDLIRVCRTPSSRYVLCQTPPIQAALISLSPENGSILAMVGGLSFSQSNFNRVTQASRGIGSAIKPFVYSSALAHGMTASTIINDAPLVINSNFGEESWRPHNSDFKFKGPIRLRQGLLESRNLVSIRILKQTGIEKTRLYLKNLGLPYKKLPSYLSLALGSASLTPLEVASGYAVIANGGYAITPHIIDSITSPKGVVYQASYPQSCADVFSLAKKTQADVYADGGETFPAIQNNIAMDKLCSTRVMSPQVNYIINNIMKDVIKEGTGRRAKELRRTDIAGKTGTNEEKDSWFAGYNPQVLTVVWSGNDDFSSIGEKEYGATISLPIWIDYMKSALKGKPELEHELPPGIVSVRINKETGKHTNASDPNSFFEIFRIENLSKIEKQKSSEDLSDDNSDNKEEGDSDFF